MRFKKHCIIEKRFCQEKDEKKRKYIFKKERLCTSFFFLREKTPFFFKKRLYKLRALWYTLGEITFSFTPDKTDLLRLAYGGKPVPLL